MLGNCNYKHMRNNNLIYILATSIRILLHIEIEINHHINKTWTFEK